MAAVHLIFFVEAAPACADTVYDDLMLQLGALGSGCIHRIGHVPVGGAEDSLDLACFEPVCKVLFQQLIGGGDGHSAQFVQTEDCEPELIMTF